MTHLLNTDNNTDNISKINNNFKSQVNPKVLVIGVGGGGCHTIDCLIKDFDCLDLSVMAVDTDANELSVNYCQNRLQIGLVTTDGLSTGDNPSLGQRAAKENIDELRNIFSNIDLVFLVEGLGGGTGTGAAPVLAEIARNSGALVLALATFPFDFEGPQRHERALIGLTELKKVTDAVITLPNQRLFDLIPNKTSLISALQIVDKTVAMYAHSIWKLLSQMGVMNLDFSDIRNLVVHSGGTCAMAMAEAEGEGKVKSLLNNILNDPLFGGSEVLVKAPALLVGITGGPDMTLVEVRNIMNGFNSIIQQNAHLIMGLAVEREWMDRIRLTVLAAEQYYDAANNDISENVNYSEFDTTPIGKGRFKDAEPTLYAGEDLDIPAFIRRGIRLRSVAP